MTTHPLARRPRLIAASTAVALAAAGAVAIPLAASATSDSPYVTVAWSYAGYPDITAPQPFVSSIPGANLQAFDPLAASPEWCGKALQVDVYQRTDAHGVSWESLKATGALLYGHDGGYLAYNAGVGTPYRVITSKEYPCTATTPTPAPTTEPTGTPSPTLPVPSSEPSEPSDEPTGTPTPSAPVTEPTMPVETPEPSAPGTATPPTIPVQPTPSTSPRSSQPSAAPAPAVTAPDAPRDLHLPLVSG